MWWSFEIFKTIQKSSLCYTFCTSPAPWYCSLSPAAACEAQFRVMKVEKECQMITKSPQTSPYHSEPLLAFYCQLHLPSAAAPNTITVLTRLKHTTAVSCWGPSDWSLTFWNAQRHNEHRPVLLPPCSSLSFCSELSFCNAAKLKIMHNLKWPTRIDNYKLCLIGYSVWRASSYKRHKGAVSQM